MSKRKKPDFEDLQRAMRHIFASEDAVVIVVRGQILIENLLGDCLNEYLHGGLKPFAGAPFNAKIRLAYAVGLLNDAERSLFLALSKIRNNLAHRLDAYVTEADESRIKELLAKLTPDLGEGEGHVVYQTLIMLLFCVAMVMAEDVKGQKPPLIAKPLGKDYAERLNKQIWLPLLAGLDPKSASALTLLFVGVLAAIKLLDSVTSGEADGGRPGVPESP